MNRSRNRRLFRIAGAFWALLLAQPAVVVAADSTGPVQDSPAEVCVPADCVLFQIDERILAVLPYPQRYQPTHAPAQGVPRWSGQDDPSGTRDTRQGVYVDDEHWLVTFSSLESLSLKTLWEDHSSRLYLGIDKTGFAGIMFGQKESGAEYTQPENENSYGLPLTGPDARPVLHSQSLSYEQPDLSEASEKIKD